MSSSCWVSCQISRLISSGCNIFKLYCRKGRGLYFCLKPQRVEIKYLLTVRLWWDCVVPLFAASFTEKMTQSASLNTVSDRNALGEDAGFVWNGSQRWDGIGLRGAHGGENVMERGNPLQGPAWRSLERVRRTPWPEIQAGHLFWRFRGQKMEAISKPPAWDSALGAVAFSRAVQDRASGPEKSK